LIDRDDRAGGRRALEQTVALAPRAAGFMTMLAQLEEEAGDYEVAIAHYWTILGLQPSNVVAMNNLAYALAVHRNAPGEALSLAKRAAGLAPRVGLILDTLGWIQHLLHDDAAAEATFVNALQLEPEMSAIHLHAAFVYAAGGQRDKAASELNEALRLNATLVKGEDVRRLQIELRGEPGAR
jgi:tetratricopeptide (TPR) repeat protein